MNYKISKTTWLLGAARFLSFLSLGVWLGGVLFLGAVAAPAISQISKAHHQRILTGLIVGQMLHLFSYVTYACGALLLLTWLGEAGLRKPEGIAALLWKAQGACTVIMLTLSLGLGVLLWPRMSAMQVELTPQLEVAYRSLPVDAPNVTSIDLPGVDTKLKHEFDNDHALYQNITMAGWWLGMIALLALSLRTAAESSPLGRRDEMLTPALFLPSTQR